jgi:2-polyprenyl-3-methyl-5-hydroxy-6-metoxy-1,4-benzoquinol methylase
MDGCGLIGCSPSAISQATERERSAGAMAERVCPWWLGYLLASPVRRWMVAKPETLLGPYVQEGMTVLEPGPGMGFFTLPLARMVGPNGRVVAVDIQPKMLTSLQRRARKAGLLDRVAVRRALPDDLAVADLKDRIDFVLAFAVVHETPSTEAFFRAVATALKPGGVVFFAEPSCHVKQTAFDGELEAARRAGLAIVARPCVRRSHAAVLRKA